MKKSKSRFAVARRFLLFWCLFIGIGALFGGTAMLIAPDGSILHMELMLPYFKVLPFADVLFKDYIFSGIALLCVNCIPNLMAAILIFRKKPSGIVCGGIFGITLMLWICIQFYMFPFNALSTSYFVFGLAQAVAGYSAWVFYKQEQFTVCQCDYPDIGANNNELVVYFSRLGYTKKAAFEEAERLGAVVYEIKATEHISGTGGFWWCGRFALHKWSMPIENINIDITQFDHVTICSPIWAFHLSAPVRAFCKEVSGKIKSVSYIFVHTTRIRYPKAAAEADRLLGLKHENASDICCVMGKLVDISKR